MISTFLKAKHWQLFTIGFGVPMLLQFVFMGLLFSNIVNTDGNPDLEMLQEYFLIIPIIIILSIVTLMGWLWSITIGLQSKIPEQFRLRTLRFKIFFFIPLIYLTFIAFGVFFLIQNIQTIENDITSFPFILLAIFPLHFFSIFCMFHTLYFAARTFKIAELQREVSFSHFIGEFFMIWFHPIGVWMVQPKVNKMIE